jgi:hypothetical protein
MPYIEPAEVERVKKIDLLDYLKQREPDELVRLGNGTYTTKTHDSLKISHGCFYWWSQGFGGRSALDYLIKVRGMAFLDAVRHLGASEVICTKPDEKKSTRLKTRSFNLPPAARTNDDAAAYLQLRGIDPHVISICVRDGLVYQNDRGSIKNVVFVGKDKGGAARYAALRGTSGDFKGEAAGSDKRFAFRLAANLKADEVHVFEGAIDALSFATLALERDTDWRELNLLTLGGVPPAGGAREQTRLPQALTQYLADNPQTRKVSLHLDSDDPGIAAANMIASALYSRGFDVSVAPPPEGKDVNEWLVATRKAVDPTCVPLCEGRLKPPPKMRAAKEKGA